jgi:hypothetical protein
MNEELTEEKKARIAADRKKREAARTRFVERNRKRHEDKKQRLLAEAEARIRSEQAQASPEHQGMAIGMMLAAETSPDLRGLVAGLAGLNKETDEQ